jgi:chromosome segregation ATPase
VTLQEIEQGFRIHEERFARIDAKIEEYEARFKRIEDNLVVQGEILNRIDQRLDHVTERLHGLTEVVRLNTNQLAVLQSAMTSLFQRMDAFIQGLDRGDGDKPQQGPR